MAKFEPILLKNVGVEGSRTLEVYQSRGGYVSAKKVLTTMSSEAVVEEVKKSNLRGRGGAGFPAGVKWSYLPEPRDVTYLCVNFDESEPGTFNNRYLAEHAPETAPSLVPDDTPESITVTVASCESFICKAASTAFSSNPLTTGGIVAGVSTFLASESMRKAAMGISGSMTCFASTAILIGMGVPLFSVLGETV